VELILRIEPRDGCGDPAALAGAAGALQAAFNLRVRWSMAPAGSLPRSK